MRDSVLSVAVLLCAITGNWRAIMPLIGAAVILYFLFRFFGVIVIILEGVLTVILERCGIVRISEEKE
jgi:hypothetical protein